MYIFVFVLTLVINFSSHQADQLNFDNRGFDETGSTNPINSENSAPTNGNQNRNPRESLYNRYVDGDIDIINFGNGNNKHNVFLVNDRPLNNPSNSFSNLDIENRRRQNNMNVGTTGNQQPTNSYGRYPNPQDESNLGNRFGGDISHSVDNFHPKTTRTGQSTFTGSPSRPNVIKNFGNGQNNHNVGILDEIPHGNPVDYNPNTGRKPNNVNLETTRNQQTTNSYGRYPNRQGETTLGNRFNNDIPHSVNNFHSKATSTGQSTFNGPPDRQNVIRNIGNGHNNKNVIVLNEIPHAKSVGPFSNTGSNIGRIPNNINVGATENQPPRNYYGRYPNVQSESSLGNRFGSDAPQRAEDFNPEPYGSQNTRKVKTYINNIGNGDGNHNTFFIRDDKSGVEPTVAVLSPNFETNKRRTNIQQTNHQLPNTNSWNTNTRTMFNQGANNPQTDVYSYSRIGQGLDNRNVIIINGKPIYSDSGLNLVTRERQGQGEQNYFNRNVQTDISEDKLRVIPMNYR